MAYSVSPTFRALADNINKEPMLILEIEGSQYLYGSAPILETARWDDPRINWDNEIGVTWDGEIEKEISRPYIIMKGKTTKQLTQQLLVDKGGSGSVATMNIELVDYRGEVAQDLSFDQIGEPLGKPAKVWMGFKGGRYPQDFIRIINGYIDDLRYNAGSITVSVALSTNLLRQSAYEQLQTQLTANINSVQTSIPVVATGELLNSLDAITSHIRIDDEIMEVTGFTSNSISVIRSRLGTIAASHDLDADVVSHYRLEGHPIDLALKLLLSSEGNEFKETPYTISAINRISSTEVIIGAIICDTSDIEELTGLVEGDFIQIPAPSANAGIYTVQGFGQLDTGKSYILTGQPLVEETGLNYILSVKSKYNVLPDGAGLEIDYVDTAAFEATKAIYSASFVDYDFLLKDTMEDVREFIIKEICRPMSLYLIPRKAKTSCKFTAPPFSIEELPVLNTQNLYDMTKIEMRRSTHKYLLNNVVFRYNQGILEDQFFDKYVRSNADSFTRIRVGRKRQEIESTGLRRDPEVVQNSDRISTQLLNRYKFGARYVRNLKVLLNVGLTIEIGDIVFFGGEDTQLVNIQTGARDLPVVQYEVINKKLDANKGECILELLETGFGVDGIFAVFSPSSPLLAGSTSNRLLLGTLWDSDQFETEREKWERWIGLKVRVRSDDYTYDELATISALDPNTPNGLILNPPLPSAPAAGYYVELAKYTDYTTEDIEEIAKLNYTFTMPQAEISAVTSSQIFDVIDASELTVGMEINVHAENYTLDSEVRTIDDITGNTITLDEALNITPAIGHKVEVYKYAEAKGYRIL